MPFLIGCLLICCSLLAFHFATKKYINPYTLTMIMGKKGSGKTTLLTKLAIESMRAGRKVYSTEKIPGTYFLDYQDIGHFMLEPNSVLLVDEVGMIWDNRNFKNFSNEVRDWFKLQRHYKVSVYLFSQSFDVDKKIRDLCDFMYIVEKKFRVFSYSKRIVRRLVVIKSSSEAPSRIDEDLEVDSILLALSGSRRFTFIPKYSKYFDSFSIPDLPVKSFDLVPGGEVFLKTRRKLAWPRCLSLYPAIAPLRKRGGQLRKAAGGVSAVGEEDETEIYM